MHDFTIQQSRCIFTLLIRPLLNLVTPMRINRWLTPATDKNLLLRRSPVQSACRWWLETYRSLVKTNIKNHVILVRGVSECTSRTIHPPYNTAKTSDNKMFNSTNSVETVAKGFFEQSSIHSKFIRMCLGFNKSVILKTIGIFYLYLHFALRFRTSGVSVKSLSTIETSFE